MQNESWLEGAPLVGSPLEVTLTPSSHTGNVDQLTSPVSDMIMQSVSCLGLKLALSLSQHLQPRGSADTAEPCIF